MLGWPYRGRDTCSQTRCWARSDTELRARGATTIELRASGCDNHRATTGGRWVHHEITFLIDCSNLNIPGLDS